MSGATLQRRTPLAALGSFRGKLHESQTFDHNVFRLSWVVTPNTKRQFLRQVMPEMQSKYTVWTSTSLRPVGRMPSKSSVMLDAERVSLVIWSSTSPSASC